MKQSTTQQDQVVLKFPDFISIGRYKKWLDNDTHESIDGKVRACEALTLNTPEEVRSIPFHVWPDYYKLSTDQLMKRPSRVPLLVKYKGEVLGINSFDMKTIGSVADIEQIIVDGSVSDIARCLITKVKSYKKDHIKWDEYGVDDSGEKVEVCWMGDVRNDKYKYELKKYDVKNLLPSEFYNDFPSCLYSLIVDFIQGVGIPHLIQASEPYSKNQRRAMRSLVKEIMVAQDGLRRSFILQRLLS